MRIVYLGTPTFAATVLDALIASDHEVVACVTRPDAVRGRGKRLVASPVKERAVASGIPVLEFSSLKSDEAYEALASYAPDALCVAAYGAILPQRVLDLPRFGCLNVHGSLLPRWRGAAPIERAILAGDAETGIGIMRMEAGLDTGDVSVERRVAIDSHTADELTDLLAHEGGEALVEVLDALEGGSVAWTPQATSGVTYAEKIAKGELDLAPALGVAEAARRVQASGASHASRCVIADRGVTVLAARPACDEVAAGVEPGAVRFAAKRLFLGCADGTLEVIEVKPDGKKPMEAKAFAAGIQGIKQGNVKWQESN